MVDRVYKAGIPALRKDLDELRREFARVGSRTNWAKLRIDPLRKHAASLEKLLRSREHAAALSRLSKGVVLFHSDLVYLRTNVRALRDLLHAELRRAKK